MDLTHVGALVQLLDDKGRAGQGVAEQRAADLLLAHRLLQPSGLRQRDSKETQRSIWVVYMVPGHLSIKILLEKEHPSRGIEVFERQPLKKMFLRSEWIDAATCIPTCRLFYDVDVVARVVQ